MFKGLAFWQVTLKNSHFKGWQTKISDNILFYIWNMYHSVVKDGVNTRFGNMNQVWFHFKAGFRPLGDHVWPYDTICRNLAWLAFCH